MFLQIPFMLDLHLFLSRPIFSAPTEDALQGADNGPHAGADVTVYGRFPQSVLDPGMERIRDLGTMHSDLENLVKVRRGKSAIWQAWIVSDRTSYVRSATVSAVGHLAL